MVGRKKYEFQLDKSDCRFVYNLFKEIQEGKCSAREAGLKLQEKYGIGNGTCYKVFRNMKIMQLLIDNKINEELLEVIDTELKVLHVIRLGETND